MLSATRSNTEVGQREIDWKRYALIGAVTVVAAVAANVLFFYLGQIVVNYEPDFEILTSPGPAIIFTFVPAVVAVLIYAALLRRATNPVRTFTIIAAVVLALSVIPDVLFVPSLEGSTSGQIAILVIMHGIAAAVIVWMLTRQAGKAVR